MVLEDDVDWVVVVVLEEDLEEMIGVLFVDAAGFEGVCLEGVEDDGVFLRAMVALKLQELRS